MPRVVHFEIPADDPVRASEFYKKAFGWDIKKWEGPIDYWLVSTGEEGQPGINGGLMKRNEPGGYPENVIDVPSIDEYIQKITASGGSVLTPKHTIPGVGYFATCADTEGNRFGIMQFDQAAN